MLPWAMTPGSNSSVKGRDKKQQLWFQAQIHGIHLKLYSAPLLVFSTAQTIITFKAIAKSPTTKN